MWVMFYDLDYFVNQTILTFNFDFFTLIIIVIIIDLFKLILVIGTEDLQLIEMLTYY